jgi:hypothetical protein
MFLSLRPRKILNDVLVGKFHLTKATKSYWQRLGWTT